MSTEDDKFWQHEYDIMSDWAAWSLNAWGLRRAADALWTAYQRDRREDAALGFAALMLTGYALENAIKGLLIYKKPALCTPERAPNWPGGGHDLTKLFFAGAVKIGTGERQLLAQLTKFVRWRGRYPMPMSRNEFKAGRVPSWVTAPFPVAASPNDRATAYRLFDRVMSLLPV